MLNKQIPNFKPRKIFVSLCPTFQIFFGFFPSTLLHFNFSFLSFRHFYTPSPEGNRLISKSLFIFMKTFRHFDILLILMNVPAPLENCRFNGKCSFNLYYAVLSVQGWSAACIQSSAPSETMRRNDEKAFYRSRNE
jgi:hypothetical protein